MADEPDPMVVELLLRDAYEELGRVAMIAEGYALKLFDASEHRNAMEAAGRLQQLRLCTVTMIQIFNLFLRKPHGQGMAEAGQPPHADREDRRPGDGVA